MENKVYNSAIATNYMEITALYYNAIAPTTVWFEQEKISVYADSLGHIEFFDEKLQQRRAEQEQFEYEMRQALEKKQFVVYMQPKYSAVREEIVGAEALVRWDHPEKGLIYPNSFVPLLYLDGQIRNDLFYCVTFDAAVLRERALALSGCNKVIYVSDEIQSQDYKAYLHNHFDNVMDFETAASQKFDDDTVALVTDRCHISGKHILLGSEAFPLPYAAYANAAVGAALKAIARDESPMDHHIRIS